MRFFYPDGIKKGTPFVKMENKLKTMYYKFLLIHVYQKIMPSLIFLNKKEKGIFESIYKMQNGKKRPFLYYLQKKERFWIFVNIVFAKHLVMCFLCNHSLYIYISLNKTICFRILDLYSNRSIFRVVYKNTLVFKNKNKDETGYTLRNVYWIVLK